MNRLLLPVLAVCGVVATSAAAQPPPTRAASPQTFTLQEALQYAADHYPSVKAALEEVNASTAGVDVAKAASLPRLDSVWQMNRATVNNVAGLLLPQSIVPAISGPPLRDAASQSAWGSAAGALFSWEPFDLGLRAAEVRSAEAALARARASEGLTRLEVETAVGAAFLAVLQAEQALTSAQADVDRRTVLARAARTLADNQLRPGAEASRADAELAAAQTRSILARQTVVLAHASLARVLGATGLVDVNAVGLLDAVSAPAAPLPNTPASHPLVQVRQAAVDAARAQEEVLADTDLPAAVPPVQPCSREAAAPRSNGALDGGAAGLGLDRANWAAGVQVVFPNLFDFIEPARAQGGASAASTRAESALTRRGAIAP